MPKDHAFGGLQVFGRDERVAIAFTETEGTETDDSRVGGDLKVPSVRGVEEEGEEGNDEVRGYRHDGRGGKVEGRESGNARSSGRHKEG